MNEKPDEHIDQWVRQALDRLPDAPPPGTTFDTERLWGKLRPELPKPPKQRWIGLAQWAAAACVASLALGWFEFRLQPKPDTTGKVRLTLARVKTSDLPQKHSHIAQRFAQISSEKPAKRRLVSDLRTVVVANPVTQAVKLRIPIVATPEPSRTNEAILPVAPSIDPTKTPTIASGPKRRFRVVHENELRSEEENRPRVYHTEGFVRLGTVRRDEPLRDEPTTAIILPLTTQTNQ